MRKISTSLDVQEVGLTIYNDGFGAIKEIRNVNLTGKETELVFADVAQKIETDSLLVEGLDVLEFNYDHDPVGRYKLLRKYIDKEVFLRNKETGERTSCRLLSVEAEDKCVLEDNKTKEIYLDTEEEMILPSLPSGIMIKPALICKIENSRTENIKVSYLSNGFSWQANYVAELQEKTLSITGWAKIKNQSGANFNNAKIKLMAGDVKKINTKVKVQEIEYRSIVKKEKAVETNENPFFDYHMYLLDHPTTLNNLEEKQINILSAQDVPYIKYYKLDLRNKKVDIVVELMNKKESGLGIVIPKGKVKFYKLDEADDSFEFVGEDLVNHTAKDEEIKLTLGNTFDITFEYQEKDVKRQRGFECYKFECTIKNHKKEDAIVHFEEHIWGIWKMLSASHQYKKRSSDLIEFIVTVPAERELIVAYEYKIDQR